MLDTDTAGMGHNQPPAYDPDILSGFVEKTDEFLTVTQQWLSLEKIESEEHAAQITDQIDGLRGLYKKVDEARKDAKRPHDAAGTEVQTAFNPLLKKLKTSADLLKPKLAEYATQQARIAQEKQERAAAEARQKAEAAEAERIAAEKSGNVSAQIDAEESAAQAEAEEKKAAKPVRTQVKSATGAGRTMSLRKVKEVTITNANVLFMALREEPEVQAALKAVATRMVRAKGYSDGKPLPGIEVNERETMA